MRIRIGYELAFNSSMATPTILMLSVHPTRLEDLSEPHWIAFDPPIPSQTYTDHFGNICTRIVMPPGVLTVSSHNVVCDRGLPDTVEPDAGQIPVENLPDESLEFLLGSRYCETDRLSDTAWSLIGRLPPEGTRSIKRRPFSLILNTEMLSLPAFTANRKRLAASIAKAP